MDNFKKVNDLVGWVIFAIATAVYFLTLEPTASWWDCGEYIATAYKLQVGHPPGAPFFQLLGRFFTLFAFGDVEKVAYMINAMSALSSSFTILFLFWSITLLAKKVFVKASDTSLPKGQAIAVLGAGAVGALAYTFSDSFWFSAVEGEVYAMSSFFTAVVFWAILRWEEVADQRHGYRWLLLIAYMVGLSIGVHLLNLLAIPAIVYVYYFKKYNFSPLGFIIAGIVSVVILAVVMYIIIPGIVMVAGTFELFFVNYLNLPFNSGTVIFFVLLSAVIVGALVLTSLARLTVLNTITLAFTFILIGYSSFFMLVIRANANTPINENDPKDALALLSYLNREQYGTWPILKGQYFNAPRTEHLDGNPMYMKDTVTKKYVVKDSREGTVPVYDQRFTTVFPRMWSSQKPQHISLYKQYGNIKGTPIRVQQPDGNTEVIYKPTFSENLRFFFTYQLDHMYLRYFMWNFVGRQNNIESQGEIQHGNWISGIGFLDNMRLGRQSNLPQSMQNPAHTKFFFLPLILGLLGAFFQLSKSKKDSWVVFLLFILTGLAIIIYLNQTPLQPRERDYAYAGSFYAFAIWIGFGVLAIYDGLNKLFKDSNISAILATALCLVAVPSVMATQGWESHDRSGKYSATDFARMYLESCEPNAILFTNGDNDTFPLWYVQEVEGVRTDVRVVNYMLSSGDWYVNQMFRKAYESEPLPLTVPNDRYMLGIMNYVPIFVRVDDRQELRDLVGFIANDDKRTKVPLQDGSWIDYMPTKKIKLTVDADVVVKTGTVRPEYADKIVNQIDWDITQGALYRNDLMLLDIIASNNWERPIYFANPNSHAGVFNVDKYCHLEGIVYRFKPYVAPEYVSRVGGVDTDRTYAALMGENVRWGRLNAADVSIDRESDRTVGIMKQNYLRLAQALGNEGKNDSVVEVLDKGLEFFPGNKIVFDFYMLPWADNYFRAGANEKGEVVLTQIANRYREDLAYYASLNSKFIGYYNEQIQESLAVIQRCSQLAKEYQLTELGEELDQVMMDNIGLYDIR